MAIAPCLIRHLPQGLDLLRLHARDGVRYPVLLESAGGSFGNARFDILMGYPGERLTLDAAGQISGPGAAAPGNDFLDALDRWWQRERVPAVKSDLPFQGGWFVFLAYELAGQVEPSLRLPTDSNFPLAEAVRMPAAVVRDRGTGQTVAIAETAHSELLDAIERDATAMLAQPWQPTARLQSSDVCEDDPRVFLRAVALAQEHIRAGDIYQANISRRWAGGFAEPAKPWVVYDRLRHANPAPFAGLALLGRGAVVSSSPERLIEVRNGQVRTRPIAGTRPRGRSGDSDRGEISAMVASPKERAEHVMLIDLERNDLGRVCEPGTVRVEDFMTVESYAHVHHIVSGVTGTLRPDVTPGAVLRAVFPGGTITGCPKVRCMTIIRELERLPRGPYTGSMGYVNRDGSCDFNILIRSIALTGSQWHFNAGSGIVADSIPERELEETRAKAKGLMLALTGEDSQCGGG